VGGSEAGVFLFFLKQLSQPRHCCATALRYSCTTTALLHHHCTDYCTHHGPWRTGEEAAVQREAEREEQREGESASRRRFHCPGHSCSCSCSCCAASAGARQQQQWEQWQFQRHAELLHCTRQWHYKHWLSAASQGHALRHLCLRSPHTRTRAATAPQHDLRAR
jgi:hypothetical protein